MRRINVLIVGLILTVFAASPLLAQEASNPGTGLPLPRFASLRSGEVNLRTGPGVQYPVEWVFQRLGMPVEIIAEYRTWRKVRDWMGVQGWVHQSMLGAKRDFIVIGGTRILHARADEKSSAVARLDPGVIGVIRACGATDTFCKVEVGDYTGWLKRAQFWGLRRDEAIP
ncbi:SH3 domain-containing protein [Varunaivibrio sulfuroxidans]|uniref:SH3-like domain-containing protein n=1 Tax=Varunaivibrio sulfuroxidans TaxID=1773489 RepID=A0A4R3JG33_9PROT|nr:SH3 domain-containing protein [Varunaivibrio sulfuroxidans]TCS65109.1 SH3-like domain-containing protein [Varunaivibrio sulfuroxidans]WES29604.1 SH3 domain-containing protein [Varunaivibrio sulfuroxidans]